MTDTYECFKLAVADSVATVTLARPPANAQNGRFREESIAIFDTLSDRADVAAGRLLATAHGIAAEIAAKSPSAVREAKRSVNVTDNLPLRDAYRVEQSQTVSLASNDETKEAQRAVAEKRKPVFKG